MKRSGAPTRAAFLLAAATLAWGEVALAQTPGPALVGEIEASVRSLVDSVPWPGAAVGIVAGDSLAFAGGFGVADRDSGERVGRGTLFQIGSVSKSFTATLAGALAERGLLEWSDPLASRMPPGTDVPETPITLGQIAGHTSGLPGDAPTLRRKHGDYPILAFTHFELYRSLAEAELQFEPGTAWGYSNFGYGVLGHVLELATGLPYETLLAEEILGPLGMESTTVTIWPELAGRLATPYIEDGTGTLVEYTPWDEEALAPAGGIASTLEDLGRYVAFQIRARNGLETRIEAATVADLQSRRWELPGGNAYGRGWFVESLAGIGEVVSVGGEVDGYTAEIALAPDRGIGAIVLVNRGDATGLPDLVRWLLARAAGEEAAVEARYRRGLLHQAAREWGLALEAFGTLAASDPPHARALYQVGRTGALSGVGLERAERALARYLALDPGPGAPSRAAAEWRLGMVLERAGRCGEANRAYRRAVGADPGLEGAVQQARASIAGCGTGG